MLRSRYSLAAHAYPCDDARSLVRQLAASSAGTDDRGQTGELSEIDALLARLTIEARRPAAGAVSGDLFPDESHGGIGGGIGDGLRSLGDWP